MLAEVSPAETEDTDDGGSFVFYDLQPYGLAVDHVERNAVALSSCGTLVPRLVRLEPSRA